MKRPDFKTRMANYTGTGTVTVDNLAKTFTDYHRRKRMSVRAKFKCTAVEDNNGESKNIRLEAVIDGSDENKSFFRWTPSGQITIGCVNEAANRQFEPGKEYYVDFTPAG